MVVILAQGGKAQVLFPYGGIVWFEQPGGIHQVGSMGSVVVTVHGHAVIVIVVGAVTVIVSPFVVIVVGDGQ